MLLTLLNGNFTMEQVFAQILAVLLVIFLILPFHEWAHAFTASCLGDKGIKARGRLSLNPISHIDPIGAVMLLLIGFGWAKPVPVDPRYFKHPKLGMAITALMGPVANMIAALAGYLVYYAFFLQFTRYAYLYKRNDFQLYASLLFPVVLYYGKPQSGGIQPYSDTSARRFKGAVCIFTQQGSQLFLPLPERIFHSAFCPYVGRRTQRRSEHLHRLAQ